jgi:serine/threonine-protein kinase
MTEPYDDRLKTGGALDAMPDHVTHIESRLRDRVLSGYKVGRVIGSGGMGYVLKATRAEGDFDRVAAIKVVPTSHNSSELALRFRTEVQILAKLNHASIAQLYDAGETEEGWPYIIMEYVDGAPIDTHCAENDLNSDDRLRLLMDVTRAVRYAHVRLIIHRDLKPSNVLVDKSGKVKLLDFGIAKLLEPGTPEQTVGHRPMTPQYASPEQLLGADITTGSDIYQLGILALAVLAGESPLESVTLQDAIRRAATGQDAPISARATKLLPADLLAIVTHCLHSDTDDRFTDVNALLADFERYRDGYPVHARKGTQLYRLKKLVNRNVSATVFALLGGIILVGGTVWYTINIDEARRVAEERAETANRMMNALSSLVTETFDGFIDLNAERQYGTAAVVESVLQDTVDILRDELSGEPEAQLELLRVQGNIERTLGDYVSSAKTFDAAAELLDSEADPDNFVQVLLARADLALRMEDGETGRKLLSQVMSTRDSTDLSTNTTIELHHMAGLLAFYENRYDDALVQLEDAINLIKAQTEVDNRTLAMIYVTQTTVHRERNDNEGLLESAGKAIALLEISEPEFSSKFVEPLRLSARAHVLLGDLAAARARLEKAESIAVGNYGEVHRQVADVHHTYGLLEYYSKDLRLAVTHVEAERRIVEELYGPQHPRLWGLTGNLAMLYTDIGESERAREMFRQRLQFLDPNAPEDRSKFIAQYNNEARLLRGTGDYETAIELHKKSLAISSDLYGAESIEVADVEEYIALELYRLGRHAESREWFVRCVDKIRAHYGEDSEEYKDKLLYFWRYDVLDGDLVAARDKLHEIMMEDIENDEIDAIWPVHLFADLAHVNLQLNDLPRALQALEWAKTGAATAPRHPWALYTALVEAEIRLATGERELARTNAETALAGLQERFPMHTAQMQRAQTVLDELSR